MARESGAPRIHEMRELTWLSGLAALLLPLLCCASTAQAGPRLELVTMGPGGALFNGFGHAALRVIDEQAGTDVVYAFGALSDRGLGPLVGWRFLRGEVQFEARVRPWRRVLRSYQRQDRTVLRQPLLLTPGESAWLVARLAESVQPENARYLYHHFRDNCATRLRDLIDEATAGAVRRALDRPGDGSSYRTHVLTGLALDPALLLVMNVVLGAPTDRPLTGWELTFVPGRLREELATVSRTVDGRRVPLTGPVEEAYRRRNPLPRWPIAWGEIPAWLGAGLAALLALAFWLPRPGRARRPGRGRPLPLLGRRALGAAMLVWALAGGLLGLLLESVVLSERVPEFQRNANLLLFIGLDLLLLAPAWSWLRGRQPRPALRRAVLVYLALRAVLVAPVLLAQLTGLLQQRPPALAAMVLCVEVMLLAGVRAARDHAPKTAPAPEPSGVRAARSLEPEA